MIMPLVSLADTVVFSSGAMSCSFSGGGCFLSPTYTVTSTINFNYLDNASSTGTCASIGVPSEIYDNTASAFICNDNSGTQCTPHGGGTKVIPNGHNIKFGVDPAYGYGGSTSNCRANLFSTAPPPETINVISPANQTSTAINPIVNYIVQDQDALNYSSGTANFLITYHVLLPSTLYPQNYWTDMGTYNQIVSANDLVTGASIQNQVVQNSSAGIFYHTDFSEFLLIGNATTSNLLIATTSVEFEINGTATSSQKFFPSGGNSSTIPSISTSTTPYQPGQIVGITTAPIDVFGANGICNAPASSTSFADDPGAWTLWGVCQTRNALLQPGSSSIGFISGQFSNTKKIPPFVFVFDVYNAIGAGGTALENATNTDLSISFSGVGVPGIVPTSSIAIISNTAYANLSGDPTKDSQIHALLFQTEDAIMILWFVFFVYKMVTKPRKQFH